VSASYRTSSLQVRGGELAMGLWNMPGSAEVAADGPVVVLIHGITSAHTAWPLVVDHLPAGTRVLAPDLRGRGRSNGLPAPYGMEQHCADVLAMMDHFGVRKATLVGHSMGAFVAVAFSGAHAERLQGLLLVDGGLPLDVPAGMDVDTLINTVLGPAAQRLTTIFPSKEAYRDFWRAHPAFVGQWSHMLEAYSDYDLVEGPQGLHPATAPEAMTGDSRDLYGSKVVLDALGHLPAHTALLTAPRGLTNTTPLYAPAAIERIKKELPDLTVKEVPDVNHYTIVMSEAGAKVVAAEAMRVRAASA
jgi:lipase